MCSNIQGHYDRGETFPCHYSRLNPWMVIEKFQRYESEVVRPQIFVKHTLLWPQTFFVMEIISKYPSHEMAILEVFHPSRDDIMFSIVASIAVPNALFVVSLSILLYWYCPYCQAKCRKYEEQVDQDERE